MATLITDLVRRQTATSLLNVFTRTADKVAEEMAQDLLHEPEFREQMRALIRAAFNAALVELQQPAPPEDKPEDRSMALRERINVLEAEMRKLRGA